MRIKAEAFQPAGIAADILMALGLLTRLPVRPAARRGAAAAWAFPLAGLAVGILSAFAGWIVLALGLPTALAAAVVLAMQALITGALHEDGLADCCDGFWGGWTRAARLRIMKDSRIGTYGVLGLLFVTLFRWAALAAILDAGALWSPVLAAAAVSRVPMVALMAGLRNARGAGLSRSVGRAPTGTACSAALIGLIVLLMAGAPVFWPVVILVLLTLALAILAQVKIGGQTGDVLGASQQLAEAAVLGIFAAALR